MHSVKFIKPIKNLTGSVELSPHRVRAESIKLLTLAIDQRKVISTN